MNRIVEFAMSCVIGILLLPIMIIISIIIKMTSEGPILFKQRRIGKYKKEFYILKFRTMYNNTPKNVPTHLLEYPEKFITPIGKIMRKTSLDEVPQIINIIKGDMSFIGPRPALYNQYNLIKLRDLYNINEICPGVTGWAQVNGRDELGIIEKVRYDKEYTEKKSLFFDIKIVFLTIISVLNRKGVIEGKIK